MNDGGGRRRQVRVSLLEERTRFWTARCDVSEVARCFDVRQYRCVSNQEGCCPTAPVREPLSSDRATASAVAFKVLGDPVRLRLLSVIAGQADGEACVCDISPSFDVSQPTISHHLKVLRDNGFVTSERRGTWVYYRVVPSALASLVSLLSDIGTPVGAASVVTV